MVCWDVGCNRWFDFWLLVVMAETGDGRLQWISVELREGWLQLVWCCGMCVNSLLMLKIDVLASIMNFQNFQNERGGFLLPKMASSVSVRRRRMRVDTGKYR